MKKAMKILAIGTMILTLVLTSCSPEDGMDGTNGAIGATGLAGSDGVDGADGNANVIYSGWFQPSAWTGSGTPYAFFDQPAVDLTQEVIDQGAVLAYAKLTGDGSHVRPLPADTANGLFLWNYLIPSVENIRFTVTRTNASSNVNPGTSNQFRYIIIPGSTLVSKGLTKNSIQKKSFEQVMDHFDLDY